MQIINERDLSLAWQFGSDLSSIYYRFIPTKDLAKKQKLSMPRLQLPLKLGALDQEISNAQVVAAQQYVTGRIATTPHMRKQFQASARQTYQQVILLGMLRDTVLQNHAHLVMPG